MSTNKGSWHQEEEKKNKDNIKCEAISKTFLSGKVKKDLAREHVYWCTGLGSGNSGVS